MTRGPLMVTGAAPMLHAPRIVFAGAGGRVGRLLRAVWPGGSARFLPRTGTGAWDLLQPEPPPGLAGADVLVCLAGVVAGDDGALGLNRTLALAAVEAAARAGVRQVICLSSIAVYGREGAPWAEEAALRPLTAYGHAKARMEDAVLARAAVTGAPGVTILRPGNVMGADALAAALQQGGAVTLDACAPGVGARRSFIGPVTLAGSLSVLAARACDLPPVLNLAQPGAIGMERIAAAARRPIRWRTVPPAVPHAELDLARLRGLCDLPPAAPRTLMAEWRAAGGGA